MTNLWGVHMPEWIGDDPIERGFVCLGWPAAGDIFALPNDREAYKTELQRTHPGRKLGTIRIDAGILLRFAHEISAGDIIVYPSKHNRMVNIGRATGKRWREPGYGREDYELPNFNGVDWLGQFPRSDFSQSALYEIGSFITLFRVRNHADEFLAKIGAAVAIPSEPEANDIQTPDDDAVSQNASLLAEETTADFVLRRIHNGLSGFEFEHFAAHLMECMGYTARVTEKTGDGGVDVIAHKDALGFQPPIIKIQCKRQSAQVGEPEVSQLLGTLGEGEYALFLTLGSYSRQARIRERNSPRLRLIDGEQLVEMILDHYPQMSPRFRNMLPLRQIYVPDVKGE
ncbi:restriction endonuclease [Sphingopyxis sp.]|uniref:restriction endonuclease n=1 Tax=Sphingopyxis sp. TaxID=1908224 RepID=UPI0035B4464D